LENVCFSEKIEGTRARGRQREKYLFSVCRRMSEVSPAELLK